MRNRYAEYNSCFDNMIRLKYVAQALNGDRSSNYPSSDDFFKQGVPFINSPAIENGKIDTNELLFISREKYDSMRGVKLRRDDILYCLRGDVGKNAMSDYDVGTIASALMVIRVQKDKYVPKFLFYVLNSQLEKDQRDRTTTGAVASNLSAENVMNFFVPHLPINEQLRLCHFLDSRVSTTDTVLENYTDQLSMLTRYKRDLIAKCVTKGLDKSAPMKPSGEDWIGDVPEHWQIVPLRSFLKPNNRKNPGGLPLLSVERERGVVNRETDGSPDNHNRVPDDLSNYKMVDEGQFVMNKMKAWQGSYGVAPCAGIVSPAYYVYDLVFENKAFFNYAIRSKCYVGFFGRDSYGIRIDQWDFKAECIKHIPFVAPPIEEQKEIVNYLSKQESKINRLQANIEAQIQKLKDYRRILIHDAVTGKIKI